MEVNIKKWLEERIDHNDVLDFTFEFYDDEVYKVGIGKSLEEVSWIQRA